MSDPPHIFSQVSTLSVYDKVSVNVVYINEGCKQSHGLKIRFTKEFISPQLLHVTQVNVQYREKTFGFISRSHLNSQK